LQKATIRFVIIELDGAAAPLHIPKDSLQEATLGSVVCEIGWWQPNTPLVICPSFCIP